MPTDQKMVAKLLHRPGVRKEVARIEREEGVLLDLLFNACWEAALTQAKLAERMGTQAPAVARLERTLATDKHSRSVATLRKYAEAGGQETYFPTGLKAFLRPASGRCVEE